MSAALWIGILALLGLLALVPRVSRWRRSHRQVHLEDALKHMLALERRGMRATPESVIGAVGLRPSLGRALIERMEREGWLQRTAGALSLTREGLDYGLQVVRAHRLWERYLDDETDLPLTEIHDLADRIEHRLSAEEADALDARLGHPPVDPHGDPIPSASGEIAPFPGEPLTDFPLGIDAQVEHLEDEPPEVLGEILRLGITTGLRVRIVERQAGVVRLLSDGREVALSTTVAANVHVGPVRPAAEAPTGVIPLSNLPLHCSAEVVGLAGTVRGLTRRRLLDLGVTPGAGIRPVLVPLFGRPRAFRIRNTLVALRDEQARAVMVRPRPEDAGDPDTEARVPGT